MPHRWWVWQVLSADGAEGTADGMEISLVAMFLLSRDSLVKAYGESKLSTGSDEAGDINIGCWK